MARRTPDRGARLLGLAAALALAAISSGTARAGASSPHLSGVVGDVYPGVISEMRVTVENRSGHAVRLRWLQARPAKGLPGCAAENLVAQAQAGAATFWLELLTLAGTCSLALWAIRRRHPQEAG